MIHHVTDWCHRHMAFAATVEGACKGCHETPKTILPANFRPIAAMSVVVAQLFLQCVLQVLRPAGHTTKLRQSSELRELVRGRCEGQAQILVILVCWKAMHPRSPVVLLRIAGFHQPMPQPAWKPGVGVVCIATQHLELLLRQPKPVLRIPTGHLGDGIIPNTAKESIFLQHLIRHPGVRWKPQDLFACSNVHIAHQARHGSATMLKLPDVQRWLPATGHLHAWRCT
mmetsp:Transcript_56436/g.134782  ORF Transcript_56436/g.134782 Transcript_56436/m.134782 type:complete len:227 (+) Transcript_56436:184-864(+)